MASTTKPGKCAGADDASEADVGPTHTVGKTTQPNPKPPKKPGTLRRMSRHLTGFVKKAFEQETDDWRTKAKMQEDRRRVSHYFVRLLSFLSGRFFLDSHARMHAHTFLPARYPTLSLAGCPIAF